VAKPDLGGTSSGNGAEGPEESSASHPYLVLKELLQLRDHRH